MHTFRRNTSDYLAMCILWVFNRCFRCYPRRRPNMECDSLFDGFSHLELEQIVHRQDCHRAKRYGLVAFSKKTHGQTNKLERNALIIWNFSVPEQLLRALAIVWFVVCKERHNKLAWPKNKIKRITLNFTYLKHSNTFKVCLYKHLRRWFVSKLT